MKLLKTLLLVYIILGISGLNTALSANQASNDFPTQERVEYVLVCMKAHGGENYNTLYGCSCAIDYISTQFSYDEFNEAQVYKKLQRSPGERGGVFRDPDQADALRDKLAAVQDKAISRCYLKPLAKGN